MMRFPSCFCFKRKRTASNSSVSNDPTSTGSDQQIESTTVTTELKLQTRNTPNASPYQQMPSNVTYENAEQTRHYRQSSASMNYGPFPSAESNRFSAESVDNTSVVYATVDKSNRARPFRNLAAEQTTTQQQMNSTGPFVVTGPAQLYANTMIDTSTHRNNEQFERYPHYDEVIVRESLQHRAQRLQHEEEQQPRDHPYASIGSDQQTTGSELYAEIANGSGSGTIPYHILTQNQFRPIQNDSSRHAPAIITTNYRTSRTTTEDFDTDIDSSQF